MVASRVAAMAPVALIGGLAGLLAITWCTLPTLVGPGQASRFDPLILLATDVAAMAPAAFILGQPASHQICMTCLLLRYPLQL